jgi:hypothetical protein
LQGLILKTLFIQNKQDFNSNKESNLMFFKKMQPQYQSHLFQHVWENAEAFI